ncbi:hypothetical protein LTR36_005076 [Oleoguttula mirabilis]|uniref:AAA+ ATPase domain-containing protein n=1 Tax=Oleoguttula mirabilis TaxID=1507867 RepID=A0AAV9JYR5_9PEZI|nr:hypothetical protein LTR36_005076 [Oleoguttula mirabilis]
MSALSITNPLVKYRALVATKQVLPDQSQLRLALHLQKLYDRLIDYEPQIEYGARLDQISRTIRVTHDGISTTNTGSPPPRQSTWRALLAAKEKRDSLALTRRLTSHESALQLTSPKGLMVHGEVGSGKSMLIDLFADCLPSGKKRRWHFNTFMLEMFAKLEALRRARLGSSSSGAGTGNDEEDHSLLWLAKDLVQTSPILFLDEFQMPDRVASKILTNLMTSFFHLGGVLVATSNRMPEELAKAAGMDFPMPAPSRLSSLGWQFGLRRKASGSDKLFGGQNEFAAFLDVLKARCEVWEMQGGRDYRRMESGGVAAPVRVEEVEDWQLDGHNDLQHSAGMAGWPANGDATKAGEDAGAGIPIVAEQQSPSPHLPVYYAAQSHSVDMDQRATLAAALLQATGSATHLDAIPWAASTLKVYGRMIPIPRAYNGVALWTFEELCKTTLGPADYISLASTFHTVILTDVPVLTWLMKNEARRFITLLDALYECRCKLYISAAAGPDELFFPEKAGGVDEGSGDAVYSETLSDVYQDATAPFRPNILSQNPNYIEPDAEPNYTHARLAGMLSADALEDDPPNKPARKNPFGRSFGRTDSEMERAPVDPDEPLFTSRRPDFGKTSAFTGEDERFAYKRAQSRLWEMCGARWWAREEAGWHRPLPVEVRRWEMDVGEQQAATTGSLSVAGAQGRQQAVEAALSADAAMGDARPDDSRPEESFRHSTTSPFRISTEPPPKFSWTHVWGTGTQWGKKAGAWGRGVEGLKDRGSEKR